MFDLPPDMPPAYAVDDAVIQQCISFNANHFELPELALRSIRKVEGGKACTVSKNTNNTADLGIMQINTIHLPSIQKHYSSITAEDLACKPCLNITVASWILKQRLEEANGDVWLAVGNYHSKTPKVRMRYLKKIKKAIASILKERKGSK